MRVYVASKFENKRAVNEAQAALRAAGHSISYDWTPEDASHLSGIELRQYLRDAAERDYAGVVQADVLVLLWHPRMEGAWGEFGIALGQGKRVVCVGAPSGYRCIFLELPWVEHCDTVAQAVYLLSMPRTEAA